MASYIDASLVPGERVIKRARISGKFYAPPAAVTLLGFGFFIFVNIQRGWMGGYEFIIGIITSAAWFITVWIRFRTTELAVTNRRILHSSGLASRSSSELDLTALESVSVEQGIFGKWLNYGSLTFMGTGGGYVNADYVESPLEFRKAVMERADAVRDWAQAPRSGRSSHGSPSGAGHLEKIR